MDNVQLDSNFGKLLIGGCGTQLGLLVSCGGIAVFTLICALCGFANVVTVGVSQDVAILPQTPTAATTVAPTPTSEVLDSLLNQVLLLSSEVNYLRSNVQEVAVAPTPTPTLTPTPTATPLPFMVANMPGINMRSGPGTDYNRVGVVPPGHALEIVGRSESSTWWLVKAPNGTFAWVSADLVTSNNISDAIPVVTIPSLMVWGTSAAAAPAGASSAAITVISTPGAPALANQALPRLLVPEGTPTATFGQTRMFVQEMPAYQRLVGHLLVPPVSESVSPHGDRIAITEKIKLYTVTTDGALSQIWLEDTDQVGPLGNIVWSSDGDYLALAVGYKEKYCNPCEGVAVIRLADAQITYLEHPGELNLTAPRWTQDGRIVVNAHGGEPASGITYVYNVAGRGQLAQGAYVLSASHEGQKWYPWRPGKTWLVGTSERADSYNAD
jgi:SH3-like domain-containing protein